MANTKVDRLLEQQKKILEAFNENRQVMREMIGLLQQVGNVIMQAKGGVDYLILHCPACRSALEMKTGPAGIIIPGQEQTPKHWYCPKCQKDYPIDGIQVMKPVQQNTSSKNNNGKEENK